MLKPILTIAIICMAFCSYSQFEGSKEIYSSPDLKTEIAKHKTVAILPFTAKITYKKLPKNYDAEANKQTEQSLSTDLQNSMYTFLLRKQDNYSCSFQDVNKTNALLKRNKIYDSLEITTMDSVCKILGVDAVVTCVYKYERTASDGAAIAKTMLFGSLGSKTGSGALTMQVYNGSDGKLLWRFYKALTDNLFGSSDQLIEHMMRKVSRNFPYDTK